MRRAAVLLALLLPAAALAQSVFGFPPVSSAQFKVAGVLQTPQPNYVDFGSGLSGSLSGGTLTITVAGGAPASTYLPLAGGTMTGSITLANSATAITSGNYAIQLRSAITDSGSAVGMIIDTTNTFSTNGDKLVSLRTGNSEVIFFDKFSGNGWALNFSAGTGAAYVLHPSNLLLGLTGLANSISITSTATVLAVVPTLPAQTANTVFAGPTSGGAAAPAFRALVSADLPSVESNLHAYNAGNLAGATAFAQFFVTNASTITANGTSETQDVVGVGGGNFVTKLCSDGTTCGAGNIYVTCTEACTAAVGTTTACTVNKSAVAASTTLTESVTTACATTDPGVNFNVHLTTP